MIRTFQVTRVRDGIVNTLNNKGEFVDGFVHCSEDVMNAFFANKKMEFYGIVYFCHEVDHMTGQSIDPYKFESILICQRGVHQEIKITGTRDNMIGDDNVVVILSINDGYEWHFVDALFGDHVMMSPYYGDAMMFPCTNVDEAAAINRVMQRLSDGVSLHVPLVMKRLKVEE